MRKASLLEQAKAVQLKRPVGAPDPELLDAALAWLKGEVSALQVSHALGNVRPANSSAVYALAAVLRRACIAGLIRIEKN
jgi:hypothetical protein